MLRPETLTVDDADDPRLADYVDLTDADLRRRGEAFIVEGALSLAALADSDYRARSVLVTPPQADRHGDLVRRLGAPVYVASQQVMNRVTGFNIHRGVLAAATRPPAHDAVDVVAAARTLVVAEGLNDQENMGALFRNARALGAGGVLLSPTCCDPLYRRCVRVSLGHVLHVPFAPVQDWPGTLSRLAAAGWTVVALTPDAEARRPEQVRVSPDDRIAVLVGAEGPGLSAAARAAATVEVRIPMAPGVDSLNVATAMAIALYCWRPTAGDPSGRP